jgi:hypothetical protein
MLSKVMEIIRPKLFIRNNITKWNDHPVASLAICREFLGQSCRTCVIVFDFSHLFTNFALPEVSFFGVVLHVIEQYLLRTVETHVVHVAEIRPLK